MTCDGRGGKGKKSISVEEFEEKLVMESIGWKLCFSTTKTKKQTNLENQNQDHIKKYEESQII